MQYSISLSLYVLKRFPGVRSRMLAHVAYGVATLLNLSNGGGLRMHAALRLVPNADEGLHVLQSRKKFAYMVPPCSLAPGLHPSCADPLL